MIVLSVLDLYKTFYLCSNDPDDNVFERITPNSPKTFDEPHRDMFTHHLQKRTSRGSRGSGSGSVDHYAMHGGTPDSPISQVETS